MNSDFLKNDPYVRQLADENHLSDAFLMENKVMISRVLREREKCLNCPGLDSCRQASRGERAALSYDGVLIQELEYCAYGQAAKEKSDLLNRYVYCDIPAKLADLDLENIRYTPDQKTLYLKLVAILYGKSRKGLYISGEVGTGKTYLCTALANSLVKRGKRVAFVKVNDFINELKSYYGSNEDLIGTYIRKLQRVEYLFLDDIGSEAVSQFVRDDVLFRILDQRMENQLLTIFTSNLDPDSLREHYQYDRKDKENPMNALRLMERIEILSDYYVLTGTNKRRE